MRHFEYGRVADAHAAIGSIHGFDGAAQLAPAQFLAGGTTLLDLMKLDVVRPARLVDINDLARDHGSLT